MKYYSNEIVFRGHPDKVCDQISDALLDAYIKKDPNSRCGIEVVGGKGTIFITGEVTSNAVINVEKIVRKTLLDIGYLDDYKIINNIGIQSSDIALGTNDDVAGAGDNGMVFGFACDDTDKYLIFLLNFCTEHKITHIICFIDEEVEICDFRRV